jgi:hypothetical protein
VIVVALTVTVSAPEPNWSVPITDPNALGALKKPQVTTAAAVTIRVKEMFIKNTSAL